MTTPRAGPSALLRRRMGGQLSPCVRHAHAPPSKRYHSTFGPTNVPSILERLRPLIPFFIKWSIITSLAVHLLRMRFRSREELAKCEAQESVLEGLLARVRQGEVVGDKEIRRELEMVGLRERTELTSGNEGTFGETADVGWGEALFGKRRKLDPEEEQRRAVAEWTESESHCSRERRRDMCGWILTIDESSHPQRPLHPYQLEVIQLRQPQVRHGEESLVEHRPPASTYEYVTNMFYLKLSSLWRRSITFIHLTMRGELRFHSH